MKKLRRSLAILVAALIVVNSTDYSLLTVNATEQTAQEGDVSLQNEAGPQSENGDDTAGGTTDAGQQGENGQSGTVTGDDTQGGNDLSSNGSGDDGNGGSDQGGSGGNGNNPSDSGNVSESGGDASKAPANGGLQETGGESEVSYIISLDFADEDQNAADQTVPIGSELSDVILPDTIKAVVAGATETAEIPVDKWEIVTPAGAEFDTSAVEGNENEPKQSFYEFAPVITLPEGYEWSDTIPEGYGSWEEYIQNWMKINVNIGATNVMARATEVAPADGTYTISTDQIRGTSGYLSVEEGGPAFAYWDNTAQLLTLLSENSTYTLQAGQQDAVTMSIRFGGQSVGDDAIDASVSSGTLQLSGVKITGNSSNPVLDFSNLNTVSVNVLENSSISNLTASAAILIPTGCQVSIAGGEGLTIADTLGQSCVQNAGNLTLSGKITINENSALSTGAINNTDGIVTIEGDDTEVVVNPFTNMPAIKGGQFVCDVPAGFKATGYYLTNDILSDVETTSSILKGKLAQVIGGTALTLTGNKGTKYTVTVETGKTVDTFAMVLPADTYRITGSGDGVRSFKYVGQKDGTGESSGSFVVGGSGVTSYTNIKQIYTPVFWQAHAESVDTDSAVLVSEVDTKHTFTNGAANYGDQNHTSQGFLLTKITDSTGAELAAANWSTAFETGCYNSNNIWTNSVSYTPGTSEAGTTYSVEVTGLKEGYTYYFVPRIVTTSGTEIAEKLEENDPLTGKTDAVFEVRTLQLNWPSEITFTYGETIGNINMIEVMESQHPSLTMKDLAGEPLQSGKFIPEYESSRGVQGSFYVYYSSDSDYGEDNHELSGEDKQQRDAVWPAGTYDGTTNTAWITFVPSNNAAKQVTRQVKVTVNQRPVTISDLANKSKVYDGTTELEIGDITAAPAPVGAENIEKCNTILNTFNTDGIKLTTTELSADSKQLGTFADKNVGEDKSITVTELKLSGNNGSESNYKIKYDTGSTTNITVPGGEITPREITVKPKDVEIKTGQAKPAFALETVGDTGLATGDSFAGIFGTVTYELDPEFPAWDANEYWNGTKAYEITIQGDLSDKASNYTVKSQTGTLTISQDEPDGLYSISATQTGDWYNADVTFAPIEESEYDQIRVGTVEDGKFVPLDGSGWADSYTFDATQEGVAVQLKNSTTNAYTAWTTAEDVNIDKGMPYVASASYRAKGSSDGSLLDNIINFVTFGNYYKGDVVVELTLGDAISGPKTLYYQIGEGEKTAVAINQDNKASFEIPAGTNDVQVWVEDNAGNECLVNLKKPDGSGQVDVTSGKWIIEANAPTISLKPQGTKVTGADGQEWYHSDVTLDVELSDDQALNQLQEQVDDGAMTGVWSALTDNSAQETDTHTYTKIITGNTNGTKYTYEISDLATNTNTANVTIRIDQNVPTVTDVAVLPADWSNDANNAQISFKASDVGSGVYSITIRKIKGADGTDIEETDPDGELKTITVSDSGAYTYTGIDSAGTYEITVTDKSGWTTKKEVVVDKLDTVDPSITEVKDGTAQDTWSATDVTLTINAADAAATKDSASSGVEKLLYKIDNAAKWSEQAWTESADSATLDITENGAHTVYLKVVDKAGNESQVKEVAVWIDKTVPVLNVSATLEDGSTEYEPDTQTNQQVIFTLDVTNLADISSDVTYWVCVGDPLVEANWKTIESFIREPGNSGNYTWDETAHKLTVGPKDGGFVISDQFSFKVTTESGLEDPETFGIVKITKVGINQPEVTFNPTAPAGNGWYNGTQGELSVHIAQATSTVADGTDAAAIHTYYKWKEKDTAEEPDYQEVTEAAGTTLSFPDSGEYTLTVYAEDDAGNSCAEKVYNFKVDQVNPQITSVTYNEKNNSAFADLLNGLTFGIFFNKSVEVNVTASDDESGPSELVYRIGADGTEQAAAKNGNSFTFELPVNQVEDDVILMSLKDGAQNVTSQNLGVDLEAGDTPVWTLENVPPVITDLKVDGSAIPTTEAEASWYNKEDVKGGVAVTAQVSDASSGIYKIDYDFGDGAKSITEPFASAQTKSYDFDVDTAVEGVHEISISATDLAQNQSQTSKGYVKIDTQAPQVSDVTYQAPGDKAWTNENYNATFTVTDPVKDGANQSSGVDSVTVSRVAGGAEGNTSISPENITYTEADDTYTITIEKVGKYQITATDIAGNETVKEFTVGNIDKLDPVKTTTTGLDVPATGLDKEGDIYLVDVPVTVNVKDTDATADSAKSGIATYDWCYYYETGSAADPVRWGTNVLWDESAPNTILMQDTGNFILEVTVYDKAGNSCKLKTDVIKINNGKPVLNISAKTDSGASYTDGTWTNSSFVTYTLNIAGMSDDEITNVVYKAKAEGESEYQDIAAFAATHAADMGAAWNPDTKEFKVSAEGIHKIDFQVTNSSGGNANNQVKTTKIDRTNPAKIDATVEGVQGSDDWYISGPENYARPSIVLGELPEDPALSETVQKAPVHIEYKLWQGENEPGTWKEKLGAFDAETILTNEVTADGTWNLKWQVKDEAGNTSQDGTTTFKVDTAKATVTNIEVTPKDVSSLKEIINNIFGNFFNDTVVITVTANDATSGVKTLHYSVEDGKSGTATFAADGTASFEIEATEALYDKGITIAVEDTAGNRTAEEPVKQGTHNSDRWTIESMAPTLSLEADGTKTLPDSEWYTTPVKLTMTAEDDGGVAEFTVTKSRDNSAADTWETWTADTTTAGQELPVSAEKEKTTTADDQGKITFSMTAKDLAGNETAHAKELTVWIDTVKPVIGTVTESKNPDDHGENGYTNQDRIYQFTVTDATSGVATVTVTDNSGGDHKAKEVADQPGTYEFRAPANGTYTIQAWDVAGNEADARTQTVEKIDKTDPAQPAVRLDPENETGNNGWYKQSDSAKVLITPTGADAGQSPNHTYYTLQKTGDTAEPQIEVTGTGITSVSLESGQWTLNVWCEDEAGNTSATITEKIKVDNDLPEIDHTGITFKDSDNNNLQDLINWLSFGNFYKEGVIVTVPVSDATSGTAKFWYQIGDGEAKSTSIANNGTATFTIPDGTDGVVKIWVEDQAGNKSDQNITLKNPTNTNSADHWVIEGVGPRVDVSVDLASEALFNEDTGWYYNPDSDAAIQSGGIKLNAEVEDTDSGLNEVKWIKTTGGQKEEISKLSDPTARITDKQNYDLTLTDGTHKVQMYAKDNSTNETTSEEKEYKVDLTPPAISQTGLQGDTPVNEPPLVTINVSDATSGIKSGSLVITYRTDDGTEEKVEQGNLNDGGYAVTSTGSQAVFYAREDAVYTLEISDQAGNKSSITVRNHLVAGYDQGEETVKVNDQPGVTGKNSSPWYNAFPTVKITTPEESENLGVTTVWYLAPPAEGELLSESEGLFEKDTDGSYKVGVYNSKLSDAATRVHVIENPYGGNPTESATFNASTYMAISDQDGNWILYAQSIDDAGNIGNTSKYYISVDRGTPVFGTVTISQETEWAKEKTVSFTVTDPYANSAPDTPDSVSGFVGQKLVMTTPSGRAIEYTAQGRQTSTFTGLPVTENGTYTLEIYDNINAKNPDGTSQTAHKATTRFTVTHIDSENPENATVTTDPAAPNGNAVAGADGYSWYIGSRPEIVITAPTKETVIPAPQTGSGVSAVTTHYEIKCNGQTEGTGEIKYDDAARAYEYTPQKDGKWEITTWTTDEAENTSGRETVTYYIDAEAPVFDTNNIKIEPKNGGTLADILNTLSFGIFFKEEIKVTVPIKEGNRSESGIENLYYTLAGEAKAQAALEKTENGYNFYSFTIDREYKGTITLTSEDKAGNERTLKMTGDMANGSSAVDNWVIDLTDPQIAVAHTPDADRTPNEYGWFNSKVDLSVSVEGGISGVNELTWTLAKDGNSPADQGALYKDPSALESTVTKTVTIGSTEDGKYTAGFNAKDNSLREASPVTETYWIDKTAPTGGVTTNSTDWATQKVIGFHVEDATSGIRKDSIEVKLNNTALEDSAVTKNVSNKISEADADKGLSEVAARYDCSFTATENGTYTVTALDAAGNTVTFNIQVSKIDRSDPQAPTIKVNNSDTIAQWYHGAYPTVTGVKNAQDDVSNNVAPVETWYKIWNSEASAAEPSGNGTKLVDEGNANLQADIADTPDTEGEWTVILWNKDAAGNISDKVTETFKVDTEKPVIDSSQTVNPGEDDPYVSYVDVKFTLDDPKKAGTGHGEPSGVDTDTLQVMFTPDEGSERAVTVTPDENGLYTIRATANGVYTIDVKDKAGNAAVTETIILTKISSVKPENAVITVDGKKGNPVSAADSYGWYLFDVDNVDHPGVQVTLKTDTPPNGDDNVAVYIKYLLWEDGSDMPEESEAVTSEALYGKDQPISFDIDQGGTWHLKYWTESESGLKSNTAEKTIYYDPDDTKILEDEIEYTDINDNPIADLINWLTFGTFFNDEVKVTIPLEDIHSGADTMTYQIGSGLEQTTGVKTDSDGKQYAQFTIPVGTKGTITLTVTDIAGNTTAEYVMKSQENGSETQWVIEQIAPVAESILPKLEDSDIIVIPTEDGQEPLTEVELKFSERVQWKEGGIVTISTAVNTYTAVMHPEDLPPTADEPDEDHPFTTKIPLSRFKDADGKPLELELDETYTMVVEAGAFMDYATNENARTLLSAFRTQKSEELPAEELETLTDLDLEMSDGITISPDFDPDTTGYVLLVGDEAMDGNNLAKDIIFNATLKGEAVIEQAILTDVFGEPLLDENGDPISFDIDRISGTENTFTVPRTVIHPYETYFLRMTTSRYGVETEYTFLISTGAYSEVVTLATSDMPNIQVEGLEKIDNFESELLEGAKVVVQFIASIPRESTIEDELNAVKAVAGEKKGYYSLDLQINEFSSDGTNRVVHEPDHPVTITMDLPEELLGKDSYEVYRNHEGEVTKLGSTLSADGRKLTFQSDKFSFYTIAYTPYEEEQPDIIYVPIEGGSGSGSGSGSDSGSGSGSGTGSGGTGAATERVVYAKSESSKAADADSAEDNKAAAADTADTMANDTGNTAGNGKGDTGAVSQDDLMDMVPQGLALLNLAIMVLSMMMTEFSYCKQRKLKRLIGTVFTVAIIAMFFLTQPLKGLVGFVDKWTLLFILFGLAHAVVTAIPFRKHDDDGKDGGETTNA